MSIINDVDCTYRKCDVTPLIFDLSTSLMLYILISLVLIFLILLYKAYTYDQAHLYRVIMIGEITEEDIEEEIKKE